MRHRLTIQQLANLCNYTWEVERVFGFHMSSPSQFKDYVMKASVAELQPVLFALQEVFHAVSDIGRAEVELKADGEHPFLTQLMAVRTPTAAAAGVDENLPLPQTEDADSWPG